MKGQGQRTRSGAGGLVLATAALLASPAAGQPPSGDQRALATALFKEGRALMDEGDYAAACLKLAESQRLDPGGGTLLNLAICHEREGKTATAWTEMHQALGRARADRRPDRVALAEERLTALEPRLCRLRIDVANTAGMTVSRNGLSIAAAAWGTAVPVDPGMQHLVARADGYRTWNKRLLVEREGTTVTVTIPPLEPRPELQVPRSPPPRAEPAPAPVGGAALPVPDGGWPLGRAFGWGFVGLATLSAGVATGAGVVALGKQAAAEDACVPRCTPDAVALHHDAKTAADVSTFWVSTAVVSAATATMLLIAYWGEDEVPRERGALLVW